MTGRFAAVHAPTLEAVRCAVTTLAGERFAIGDLSFGAWRPHGLASDVALQLGCPFEEKARAPQPVSGFAYADVIDRQIDAEARGDAAVLGAYARAARLPMPATLFVIPPRFGAAWEREDTLFLLFAERRGARVILLAGDGDVSVPAGCRAEWVGSFEGEPLAPIHSVYTLVPELLRGSPADGNTEKRANLTDYLLPLAGGLHLVAPEVRRDPRSVDRLAFDRLAVMMDDDADIAAYAQFHGNTLFVEPELLAHRASAAFNAGATGIATRLLERAAGCASGVRQAAMLCQLQGMRIAAGSFADTIAIAEPPLSFPVAVRSFLLEARGWGLVMCGRPREAAEAIEQARALRGEEPHDRESLYLLNILALCCFRSGDLDAALALEREIEREAAALPAPSWPLLYVNAINQARIHRRRGELDAASAAYRKAFATTLGARSDGDAIYTNVCLANLAAERGLGDEAFACRVRAALHFCACEVPEALGARIVRAIVPHSEGTIAVREEIAAALLAALRESATRDRRARIDAAAATRAAPRFVRFDRAAAPDRLLLGDGWSAIALSSATSECIDGEALRQLRTWLGALLDERARYDAFAIDGAPGEMAAGVSEALATCVRLGVPRLEIEKRTYDLTPEIMQRLAADARATIAPHVSSIERIPPSVTFKRYLAPRALTRTELTALERIVHEHVAWNDPLLAPLIDAGVVTLQLSEDACETAGIRRPSGAMSLRP